MRKMRKHYYLKKPPPPPPPPQYFKKIKKKDQFERSTLQIMRVIIMNEEKDKRYN